MENQTRSTGGQPAPGRDYCRRGLAVPALGALVLRMFGTDIPGFASY